MKVLFLLSLFVSQNALAQETWERCMDQGDFSFSADTFLKSHRVSKSGCVMKFVELSGKGAKYEINICDPVIKIKQYEALDSDKSTSHYAGSSGCPTPLFGADFGNPHKGGVEFGQAKEKLVAIFAAVKKVYGPTITAQDAAKISNPSANSEIKIACAQLFLDEYLGNCTAFESKPSPETIKELEKIPGVHPQTIKD